MIAQVKKWGNSQGIRLSRELLKAAGIENDEVLDVTYANGSIILSKQVKHRTLEERAEVFGGMLGPYEEMDFGESLGRERWFE